MKILLLSLIITLLLLFALKANAQCSLNVKVDNLEDSRGRLMVALFNSEATFLSPMAQGKSVSVEGVSSEVIFGDLPEGEYAIALFQDENSNFMLDMDSIAIPTERYGFSNDIDPRIIGRKPNFDECKFNVRRDTAIIIQAVVPIHN